MKAMILEAWVPWPRTPIPCASPPFPTLTGAGENSSAGHHLRRVPHRAGRDRRPNPPSRTPRDPGPQVVGTVEAAGPGSHRFETGDRVGVAWIFDACGECLYCQSGDEISAPDSGLREGM